MTRQGRRIRTTKERISAKGAAAGQLVPAGTVLLSFKLSIGRVARTDIPIFTNEAIAALPIRDSSRLNEQYLEHALAAMDLAGDSNRAAMGATLNKAKLRDVRIPVPALPEQRRIAAILDHADALRAKRRETIAGHDGLRRSIYDGLFGGFLRSGEHVALGDVLASIDSGRSPQCLSRAASAGERGVLKLSAVTTGTYLPAENKALPDGQTFNPLHEVRSGDLLFTRKNTKELVAACAYVLETPPGMLMPDLIFRLNLREDSGLSPRFVQHTLMHPEVRRRVQRLAGGSAGSMPNVSKAKLATVRIPRPPYEMQREFDRRLEKLDVLVPKIVDSGRALDALFSSLQSRAFRGEL